MDGSKPNRGQLVRDTIKQFPDADNRTLARLLIEQYPHAFGSVEATRSNVRYYRGNNGNGNRLRRKNKDSDLVKPNGKAGQSIKIPPGIRQRKRTAHIKQPGTYLIISDVHVPFHNEQALEAALRFGRDNKAQHLILNGDFVDFYKLSRWSQDPRERNPHEELETAGAVINELMKQFAGSDSIKLYKVGNHEERYETFLFQRASALVGIEQFELKNILPIDKKEWRFIESKQLYKLGKLNMLHGHEAPRGLTDPVNIARGIYLRLACTAMVGHWHRTSTHVETTGIKETITPCYSLGCCCDLSPSYAPINKWNHGCALVTLDNAGNYQVRNVMIHQGQIYET